MKAKRPNQQRVMRYVYLFELDSVRRSEKEISIGLATLTRTLMEPDTCVILSYNQIGDGTAMIRCFADPDGQRGLVEMFRRGRIKINRYNGSEGLVKYVMNACKRNLKAKGPRKGFLFSSLEFLGNPWYSDGFPEAKGRAERLLSKLITALDENDYSAFDSPKARGLFESLEDQKTASSYLQTVLDISVTRDVYIDSKPPGQSKAMASILREAIGVLSEERPGEGEVLDRLETAITSVDNPSNRSQLYDYFEIECPDTDMRRRCKRVIDLAYNFTCMDSIDVPGLSYEENDFPGKLKALVDNGYENL